MIVSNNQRVTSAQAHQWRKKGMGHHREEEEGTRRKCACTKKEENVEGDMKGGQSVHEKRRVCDSKR